MPLAVVQVQLLHQVTVWYCSKGSFIPLCGVMWVSAADSLSKVSSPPPPLPPGPHIIIVTVSRCHQACLPVSLCLERRVGLRVDGTVVPLLTHDTGWREKKWRLKKQKHIQPGSILSVGQTASEMLRRRDRGVIMKMSYFAPVTFKGAQERNCL